MIYFSISNSGESLLPKILSPNFLVLIAESMNKYSFYPLRFNL